MAMAKVKRLPECPRCESPLAGNQCFACGLWVFDTLSADAPTKGPDGTVLLSEVKSAELDRLNAGIFNYVWSGFPTVGVVRTSCTLVGGQRGAGKSTMLVQLAALFASQTGRETGFIAAEQALEEVKLYADRLKIGNLNKIRMVPAMTGTVSIGAVLQKYNFGAVILDSLQGLVGDDENACVTVCNICKEHAMRLKAPVMIVSHINKEGDYAGFEKIQHAVDTLLMLSVDEESGIRTIDVHKNRFGKAQIYSEFNMTETGLTAYIGDDDDDDDDS
jgi:DNA repair protein RadA/Sms